MKNIITKSLISALLISAVSVSNAQSGITITPLRFELSDKEKMTAAHISNKKSELLFMKTKVYSWKQEDGFINKGKVYEPKDILEPTKDIKFYPENFVVKKSATQTVRLQMISPEPNREYRVFFEEIKPTNNVQDKSIQFLTTVSLPLFNYKGSAFVSENDFKLNIINEDGVNYLEIRNNSKQTIKLIGLKLNGEMKQDLGYYLQPNIKSYIHLEQAGLSNIKEVVDKSDIYIVTDKGDWKIKI